MITNNLIINNERIDLFRTLVVCGRVDISEKMFSLFKWNYLRFLHVGDLRQFFDECDNRVRVCIFREKYSLVYCVNCTFEYVKMHDGSYYLTLKKNGDVETCKSIF